MFFALIAIVHDSLANDLVIVLEGLMHGITDTHSVVAKRSWTQSIFTLLIFYAGILEECIGKTMLKDYASDYYHTEF